MEILLIDDNQDLHEIFEILIRVVSQELDWDVNFHSAYDGAEGVKAYNQRRMTQNRFDVIITDMRMPNLDGVEVMKQVWQRDPQIPIIFCTAYSDISWDELKAQFNNPAHLFYLKKPFNKPDLSNLLLKAYSHIETDL